MPRRTPLLGAAALVALAAALGGCSEAQKAFGLTKTPPDEFEVVAQAPLSLPPSYALVPPTPGAPRPQVGDPRFTACNAVIGGCQQPPPGMALGDPSGVSPDASPGEQALLASAGAIGVGPGIRQEVNAETEAGIEGDKAFMDTLIFWRKPDQPGDVIDPEKEQQRLEENAALGRPVTEGETPIIIRRKKALLEGIF